MALLGRDRVAAAEEFAAAQTAAAGAAQAAVRADTVASVLADLRQDLAAAEGVDRYQVARALIQPGGALLECYTREIELVISLPAPPQKIALGVGADCSSKIPIFMRFKVVA